MKRCPGLSLASLLICTLWAAPSIAGQPDKQPEPGGEATESDSDTQSPQVELDGSAWNDGLAEYIESMLASWDVPYVGTYTTADSWMREIVLEEGELFLLGTSPVGGGPPMYGRSHLFGLEDDVMFIRTDDAVFRFRRDESGVVVGFDERFAGQESSYTKM